MRDHWDRVARTRDGAERAVWDQIDWDSGTEHCVHQLVPALEDRAARSGARVVEIGCGVARLLVPLAMRWPLTSFVGLDTSPNMITWAHRTMNEMRVDSGLTIDNVTLIEAGVDGLIGGPWDAAYSVLVFQHLDREVQRAYIDKLGRWLVRDGVLRLQYVPEGDEGVLSHPVDSTTMRSWCRSAGLRVEAENDDPRFETWRWLTAVRV